MIGLDVLDIIAQGDARALIHIYFGDIRGPSFKKDVVVLVLAVREFGRFRTLASFHEVAMKFLVNREAWRVV
jgi:hypothetical protein